LTVRIGYWLQAGDELLLPLPATTTMATAATVQAATHPIVPAANPFDV